MNKNFKKLLSVALAAGMVGSTMAACTGGGGNNSDSAHTLDIYLLYKGYQDEWLTSTIELFKQQDWVKQEYPDLEINYEMDSNDSTAGNKLSAGASINYYDLMFGVNLGGLSGTNVIADLTETVYNATVPGESVKVRDKIPEKVLNQMVYEKDNVESYYTMCYIEGFYGMMYNADILSDFKGDGWIPVTTNELLDVCATIKGTGYDFTSGTETKKVNTTIMNCSSSNYWKYSFPVWWAQYEGLGGYESYYDGIFNEERSPLVATQTGRLRSLEFLEELFSNYAYESASAVDYIISQTNFLSGNGVFHFNGDYFASEMALSIEALAQQGISPEIRFMKMPVISTIVEKLEYRNGSEYMSDALLAEAIRDIDANKTYAESSVKNKGVSEMDFEIIAEARRINAYSSSGVQTVVVPGYSPAQQLACDFLKFMYTDEAIANFIKSSKGVIIPSTYDVLGDSAIYASLNSIQKSKIELQKGTSNYEFIPLPPPTSFPLGRAGLTDLPGFTSKIEVLFALPENQRAMHAADIHRVCIDTVSGNWGQWVATIL